MNLANRALDGNPEVNARKRSRSPIRLIDQKVSSIIASLLTGFGSAMSEIEFTAEIDEYVVLKLRLEDYRPGERLLPVGFELADPTIRSSVTDDERRLLQRYFRNWQAAYSGQLKGWRRDSPIYVLRDGRLIGGVYLVAGNEFDDDQKWGQLHYAFMEPSCKGMGIYRIIFTTAVERARSWGLEGLYLNSDRHLLSDVYVRWGGVYWKTISKPNFFGRLAISFGRLARRATRRGRPR